MKPDSTYVTRLVYTLQEEWRGFNYRVTETEDLRYLEDRIALSQDEKKTGIEVRIGATAELIENVKASLITEEPIVVGIPFRDKQGKNENIEKREKFYMRWLGRLSNGVPVLNEYVDSTVSLGVGWLKAAKTDYYGVDLAKHSDESESEHVERVIAEKRLYGLPYEVITVHPSAIYPRFGVGHKLVESVEHSWKSRTEMYRNFGIEDFDDWKRRGLEGTKMLSPQVAQYVRSSPGYPVEEVKPLPYGTNQSNLCLVTEYLSPDIHQVYIDRRCIYEEEPPQVQYFPALGRTNSSRENDKLAFGVAEILRHNEPSINRAITRMLEANELLVRQRLTVELPEGSADYLEQPDEDQGESRPRQFIFRPDVATALPPGANVVNPYAGVEHAFQSMPVIQLLMSIMGEHGVSPLFKGIPPGAVGSGYRDNSLFTMARSQYQYIIDSIQNGLTQLIKWLERQIVADGEIVYLDELSLSPSDIKDWPADMQVVLKPILPQNMIAEGTFYDRMFASRHITRRVVREKGLNMEDPAAMEREVMVEDLKEVLKPQLYLDVMANVNILDPAQQAAQAAGGDPNAPSQGAPANISQRQKGTGASTVFTREGAGAGTGQQLGGYSHQGQPVEQPASTGNGTAP